MFGKTKTSVWKSKTEEGNIFHSLLGRKDSHWLAFLWLIEFRQPSFTGYEAEKGTAFKTGAAFDKKAIYIQI